MSIQSAATLVQWMLVAAAFLLLGSFAWAALQNELIAVLQKTTPEQLRDMTLFVYFASWVVAMGVDLRIHKSAYQQDMGKRDFFFRAVGSTMLLLVVALILIWSRRSTIKLAIFLDIFFAANFLTWLQANVLARSLIASTRASLAPETEVSPKSDQLNVIASYMSGRWQVHRFRAMLVTILLVNIAAFSDSARGAIGGLVHWAILTFPQEKAASFAFDLLALLFVLVAEVWSWSKRLVTVARLRHLKRRSLSEHPRLAEYMIQFFDQQFKAVNYLMIAHAAALLATLTVVKDYLLGQKGTSTSTDIVQATSKTIGAFVGYFSWGLALAILAYVTLSIARDSVLSAILLNFGSSPEQRSYYIAWILCAGSALLLLTGIFTVAGQVSGVRIPL
jgi:hypothetical protein